MKNVMAGQWWVLLVRGILTLIFGIIAVTNVQFTILAVFIWFVFYALADGIFNAYMSYMDKENNDKWWVGLLGGVFSMVLAIAAFTWPQLTAFLLLMFIAAKAVFEGVILVVTAIQIRKEVKGEWLLILGGAVAIIFGLWMFFHPLIGGLALLWIVGIYATIVGFILIVQAFRMRGLSRTVSA